MHVIINSSQMHVARVYFQQPIATQIALQAVPLKKLYPERRSRRPACPADSAGSLTGGCV